MKTKTIILAVLFILGILLTSCSSSNHVCPAYSQEYSDNVAVEKS